MTYDSERIKSAMEGMLEVYDLQPVDRRQAMVFHLTDWLEDLHAVHQFFSSPESFNADEIHRVLIQFLTHAPNHIAAASKLILNIPVTDVFNVGATTESDDHE